MLAMAPMPAVPAMHEDVHQGASEDQKPWQHAEQMRPVLGPQIEDGNDRKADQDDAAPGAKQAAGAMLGICCHDHPPSVHAW
jgi:hypothetical protein